ncbi:MAG: hypothetical protein AB1508_19030 [Pseudomonadota bacterium]
MPEYCFTCRNCRTTFSRMLPVERRRRAPHCPHCRGPTQRDLRAEHGKFRATPGNWPMVSAFAGIHPDQIEQFREFDRRHGVPTDYTPDGDVVFESRSHRKRYCELHGLYDRNGGYGDPQKR